MRHRCALRRWRINTQRLLKITTTLGHATLTLGAAALLYRATYYWQLPPPAGARYGLGDILDFGLGLGLFLICSLCATSGVMLKLSLAHEEQQPAYRAVLIGISVFVVYYLAHPHVPRLM